MDNESKARPLPEKVLRRHADMLDELLPEITRLVTEEGRPADGLLSQHLRTHKELGSRDRRFLAQAVFSYFRWYGWTVNTLRLPAAEACLIGNALESTTLTESFKYLEKRCALPVPLKPMGDKTLAEKAVLLPGLLQTDRTPELSDLVPPDFQSMIDPAKAMLCIEQFQQRPPAWIRARTDREALLETLAAQGIACTTHDGAPQALAVPGGVSLAKALSPHTAQFVVQDIASQCVGRICAPREGDDWWDCCAGAGGKSLQLMDLMQQNGRILASDVRGSALRELKKRARKYGIRNLRTQVHNAVRDEPFTKTFDGILVDAPCSGWGTWPRNPDARWRTSKRDVTQCAARQVKILNNAGWCTRPGGKLIYAVCSFTRPETEEVVMHFLDQNPHFKLDPFAHPLTGALTDGQLQIWPWEGPGDAMFIARLVRDAE